MNEVNPAFKYKIIWKHDGKEEILYALSHSDAEEVNYPARKGGAS